VPATTPTLMAQMTDHKRKHRKLRAHAMTTEGDAQEQTVETMVPARVDRLPWSRWHLRIVIALGTSWLLDGLQVTLAGSLAGVLEDKKGLGLSAPQVTAGASTYLAGAVLGALFFGYLTDRLGRRKLFLVTLATNSIATLLTAISFNFWSFALFRALTGFGIGGEYAAINSAVDELIPGKVRGTVDLVVNATCWLGAIVGSLASFGLLNTHLIPTNIGWRAAFSIAALLGGGVLILRLAVPESPRWLMLRGHSEDADRIVSTIEEKVRATQGGNLPEPEGKPLKLAVRDHTPWGMCSRRCCATIAPARCLLLFLWSARAFSLTPCFSRMGWS
jgi:MFS family permease